MADEVVQQELWVALVGSAPASVRNAPYGDPRWQIYGCSPGVYGVAPRVNEWFELHLWEPGQTWFSPEYVQWLQALPARGVKLWTGAEDPTATTYGASPVAGGQVLPWKEILAKYDPQQWFCTSSLFWMMARAIDAGATRIGLWGVDMAANEEYEMQRAGIHHMTYIARSKGIEVGIPPESDLFTPRFRYGIDEWTHSYRKLRARQSELQNRKLQATQQRMELERQEFYLAGALDDLNYCHQTWADKRPHTAATAVPGT